MRFIKENTYKQANWEGDNGTNWGGGHQNFFNFLIVIIMP